MNMIWLRLFWSSLPPSPSSLGDLSTRTDQSVIDQHLCFSEGEMMRADCRSHIIGLAACAFAVLADTGTNRAVVTAWTARIMAVPPRRRIRLSWSRPYILGLEERSQY